jgi:ATP-dependent DNA helicase RecG
MTNTLEYENIEYKQSLSELRAIIETVAAFATTQGGTVRIGQAPDGRHVGVQLGRNTLENLANDIKHNTSPAQFPSITVEGAEESATVIVRVGESPIKPVWAYNTPFKRVGRTNQKLSREETQRLADATAGRTWETLRCPGLRMEDLDRNAIKGFLEVSGQDTRATTESVLQNLGLVTSEGLGYGAALLFAKNPQRFLPEAQVKCARFAGTTSVRFLDEQTLEGNLLAQPDAAIAFVMRNIRQGIRITGRAQREVVPEYPEEAIREAIVNAVCHRDYTAVGTVQVRIYDDRLEVWNPGMLPPGLTVEELYLEHPSRPRHPSMARALHRAHIMEHWGTGTLRIVQACVDRGLARPEFRSQMGEFMVLFRSPAITSGLTVVRLTPRQDRALVYAREKGSITRAEYEELFRISSRQAIMDLKSLVDQGLLFRVGKSRATLYTPVLPTEVPTPDARHAFQAELFDDEADIPT